MGYKNDYTAESAYEAIALEAAEQGWPKHYGPDLWFHDHRRLHEADDSVRFIWVLRELGTHLIMDNFDAYEPKRSREKVFGARKDHARAVHKTWPKDAKWYCYERSELRTTTANRAPSILTRWYNEGG